MAQPVPAPAFPAGRPRLPRRLRRGLAGLLGVLCFAPAARSAVVLDLPVEADTYLDSRTSNANLNYGTANTVKVLVNSDITSDGSLCRGLLHLPDDLALFDPADIAEARLRMYVWQDNTGDLGITLFPLLRPFVEGTGNGDGATWYTSDGTNAWTSAGGDFDTNCFVTAVKEDILDPDMHDRFFSWDITPLLTNNPARSNLFACGVFLRIDESPFPSSGSLRAPFTSSDALSYAAEYRPHIRLTVRPRMPAVQSFSRSGTNLVLAVSSCTPLVTNRLEWKASLLSSNDWISVAAWTAAGTGDLWQTSFPLPETNGFYRICIPDQESP